MSRRPTVKAIPVLAAHHADPPLHIADFASGQRAQAAFERRWGPNLIANAERKMAAILEAAELPTEAGFGFQTNRGLYRGLDALAAHRGHQVGSEVWYAAKIVEEIANVRHELARADHDGILHASLHLGALLMEASIVVSYGREFDVGVKVSDGLAKRRQGANAQRRAAAAPNHRRWIAEAQDMWKRNPPSLRASLCAESNLSTDIGRKNEDRRGRDPSVQSE